MDLAVGAHLVGLQLEQALQRLLIPLSALTGRVAAARHDGAHWTVRRSSSRLSIEVGREFGWRKRWSCGHGDN